jgi:hypothetical protein
MWHGIHSSHRINLSLNSQPERSETSRGWNTPWMDMVLWFRINEFTLKCKTTTIANIANREENVNCHISWNWFWNYTLVLPRVCGNKSRLSLGWKPWRRHWLSEPKSDFSPLNRREHLCDFFNLKQSWYCTIVSFWCKLEQWIRN